MSGEESKVYVILAFRVPTSSVGTRGEGRGGARDQGGVRGQGSEGSKVYIILGSRVLTTCDDKNFDYHI